MPYHSACVDAGLTPAVNVEMSTFSSKSNKISENPMVRIQVIDKPQSIIDRRFSKSLQRGDKTSPVDKPLFFKYTASKSVCDQYVRLSTKFYGGKFIAKLMGADISIEQAKNKINSLIVWAIWGIFKKGAIEFSRKDLTAFVKNGCPEYFGDSFSESIVIDFASTMRSVDFGVDNFLISYDAINDVFFVKHLSV